MTDTVTSLSSFYQKSWAELAEEEDEYLEQLQNQNTQQAGKQLSNFQKRLIDRIQRHQKEIEVGLQQVPNHIKTRDIYDAFRSYNIKKCAFQRSNCFFFLSKEQAIRLVEDSNLRITIKEVTLNIVMMPLKN